MVFVVSSWQSSTADHALAERSVLESARERNFVWLFGAWKHSVHMKPMRAVVPEPNATRAHAPRSPSAPTAAFPMKIGECQLFQPVGPVPDEHWTAYCDVVAQLAHSLPML